MSVGDEGNKAARNNQLATLVQWKGRTEARRIVERRQKADGHCTMANEGKKMIQTGVMGSQMVLLPSVILDTSMRTATDTS